MHKPADFSPAWSLRHPHVQSFLASSSLRRWARRGHAMAAGIQSHVLDCGDGVRLLALHSPQPAGTASAGTVVLIHGWEGSHDSAYLYSLACTMHEAGYSVWRLNLRDHGGTHHLNEALFHSARIAEVIGAVKAIAHLDPGRPLAVIGFSLGGNFALRVGLRGPAAGITPDLAIGVCPAINPGATLRALDEGPLLYRGYFLKKWRNTLAAKSAAWPGRYDFTPVARMDRFVDITARFVADYTEYGALEKYLAAYTLGADEINESPTKLAIITAQDDPVVPFGDFAHLAPGRSVELLAPQHGGHCGFVESLRLRSWAERRILDWLGRL